MTAAGARRHRVERHAVLLASGASLSFQRYLLAGKARFGEAPQSLGALPCAAHGEGVLVPLPEGEGMWIACLPAPEAVQTMLSARPLDRSARATKVMGAAPAMLVTLPGLRRGTGDFGAIRRDAAERMLQIAVRTALPRAKAEVETLTVTLVAPERFRSVTGWPVLPADPLHAFGGWRLP